MAAEATGAAVGAARRGAGRVGMGCLGIEHLSVFGLPPVEFVNLTADLGLHYIATALTAFPFNPHGYAAFSLRDDVALRREMIAAMRDRDVSISLGEGFSVRAQKDMSGAAGDLDIMRELGVTRINTVGLDPDRARTFDQFGVLAGLAAARGMETTLEFGPGLTVGNLATALAAIQHVGRPDFRLLIDTMHLVRSGSVLPPNTIVGLEVPLRSQAEAGIGPQIRLQRCVAEARRLMANI